MNFSLSAREANEDDYESIVDYFLKADPEFYKSMGVDPLKLPKREDWLKLLSDNHKKPVQDKTLFYVIWQADGTPLGHSNINKIVFGEEAYMHLHMWRREKRQKGMGLEFVKLSIPYYFTKFNLKKLYCEPYALNTAPNKTLKKIGFSFIEAYETTPGWISFHQPVKRWCMDSEQYRLLFD
jgi:RimJ/RimL family protein N-acetyltransferase